MDLIKIEEIKKLAIISAFSDDSLIGMTPKNCTIAN